MPYVPVPRDLTKVKTKVALGLTKRQLVCFGIGALIGIPVFFLTRSVIGNSPAVLVMIAVMLPAFFMAMFERDGQPAEKILLNMLRSQFIFPQTRPYKTENFYSQIGKEVTLDPATKATGKTTCPKPTRSKGE